MNCSFALFKVAVHLERYFQFAVWDFVNTHRTPTTYISMESLWNYLKAALHESTCNNDFPPNTVSCKIDPRVTCHRERFIAQHWVRQHVASFWISFKNTIRCCAENQCYKLTRVTPPSEDPASKRLRMFLKPHIFLCEWPSVHAKPMNPLTEPVSFWNRSPEWIFFNPPSSRIRVDGRNRIFSNPLTSWSRVQAVMTVMDSICP